MADDRKLEILDATCRVIAREGADGLRMGTVAARGGRVHGAACTTTSTPAPTC